MRYPQFFATRAFLKRFEQPEKNGIIWHTQGSGKTALAAFSNRVIKDYFGHKKVVNTRFFFVVDRLDLLRQAKTEFENRGFYLSSLNVYQGIIKICSMLRQIVGNASTVFFRCQIHNRIGFGKERLCNRISPKFIEIATAINR